MRIATFLALSSLLVLGCDDGEDTDDTDDADTDTDTDSDTDTDTDTDAFEEVDCASVTADVNVDIIDLSFEPDAASVPVGGVIAWTNLGSMQHTVTSGDPDDTDAGALFDSGTIEVNESYCLRVNSAVTSQAYFCAMHPDQMQATLSTE